MTRQGGSPDRGKWRGPVREYDLVKEFVIALAVVALLTGGLAAVFSSPDEKDITLRSWAQADPADFVATATGELAGTTTSAAYGPPYNTASDGMHLGPLYLQKWAGVRIPVDSANDFVVTPLSRDTADAAAAAALAIWKGASPDQQAKWATAYADALTKADGKAVAPDQAYGPVPAMTTSLLAMARSGALDSDLVQPGGGFYNLDYTRPILFLADGAYFDDQAGVQHLHGEQWGMMNETGNYPGQAWLWLYSFWYQVPPFTTSWGDNADVIIFGIMGVLSLILLFLPFIPGLRRIPNWIPVYKLVWKNYYRRLP